MRLIDAEKIPFDYSVPHIHGFHTVMEMAVEAMPTVEAIPIEWLEKEIEHARENGESESSFFFIEYCIDLWKGKIENDQP